VRLDGASMRVPVSALRDLIADRLTDRMLETSR
jgi:hypothetical protein